MTSWWKCVAVAAAWLALEVAAQAQQEIPSPVGAARMIEPLGYTPKPQPDLVPGPLTPLVAPPGPPDCLALPASHSSAFQCENYATESACFGALGMVGLQRYHPGKLAVAFDQSNNEALNLREINPRPGSGVKATVGYLIGNSAVELTGFFQPSVTTSRQVAGTIALGTFTSPGQFARTGFSPNELAGGVQGAFNVPFIANGPIPPAFGGVDGLGLWHGADLVKVSYASEVGGGEINCRTWDGAINGFELILGVRALSIRQSLNIFTDQLALTDRPDPLNTATYGVSTLNNIVGLQFGTEYSTPCPIPYLGWIWFTGMGKAAVGPNFVDRDFNLSRGDFFNGFHVHRSNVEVGQIYELSGFIDLHLAERIRLRAGYQALWAVGISNPATQANFNLSAQPARKLDSGSALYSGPVAELELLW